MSTPNAEILVSVELLRMILDLPASYRVVGAETERYGELVSLLVESDRLPAIDEGDLRHQVTPIMQRVEGGQATLAELRVVLSTERDHSSVAAA
jgi:hypothetical protein